MENTLFNTKQAASYLGGFNPHTLEKWRHLGRGPVFLKLGYSVFYDRRDLDAWINDNRRVNTVYG